MDTKDQDSQAQSQHYASEAMMPDTTMFPGTMEIAGQDVTEIVTPEGTVVEAVKTPLKKSPTPLQDSLRRLRRDKRAMVSLSIIILFILIPIFGPFIYQHIGGLYTSPINGVIGPSHYHSPFWQESTREDELASAQYWLGTDSIGRDQLARLMQGMLISVDGGVAGGGGGYRAGCDDRRVSGLLWRLDRPVMHLYRYHVCLPRFALCHPAPTWHFGQEVDTSALRHSDYWPQWQCAAGAGLAGAGFYGVAVDGSLCTWTNPATKRAAVCGGRSHLRHAQSAHYSARHIVPNLSSIVVVASTLNIAGTVIGEAGLSLLGLGVQQPGSTLA